MGLWLQSSTKIMRLQLNLSIPPFPKHNVVFEGVFQAISTANLSLINIECGGESQMEFKPNFMPVLLYFLEDCRVGSHIH